MFQDVIQRGSLQMDGFFKFSIIRDISEVNTPKREKPSPEIASVPVMVATFLRVSTISTTAL